MSNTDNNKFKYIIDEFADCKVLRYQTPDWDSLSLRQKQYIYCLSEAALWGRDIYFEQNFKENLKIRKVLEQILKIIPLTKIVKSGNNLRFMQNDSSSQAVYTITTERRNSFQNVQKPFLKNY